MQTFTDSAKGEWRITITVGAIKRVIDLVHVNLAELLEGEPTLMHRLSTDIVLMVDVLFALIEPQARERNITDEQFGESLGGAEFLSASRAFWKELNDFFRESPRPEWARLIETQLAIVAQRTKAIIAIIENSKATDTPPGTPCGGMPASSA